VLRGGEEHTGFRCRNLKEIDHLENPDVNEAIILKCNLNTSWLGGCGQNFSSSGERKFADCFACGNKLLGFVM
jgi:hypothetical protein